MNYQITFIDETSYVLTGVTFNEVVNYSQTVGKELSYINEINFEVVKLGELSNNCYNVLLKNSSLNSIISYMIFSESLQFVTNWINQQQNTEVLQFGISQKTLVIS